eukprot:COSAG02_NODE_4926_length_4827_cov_2.783418_8_plen_118_part_00
MITQPYFEKNDADGFRHWLNSRIGLWQCAEQAYGASQCLQAFCQLGTALWRLEMPPAARMKVTTHLAVHVHVIAAIVAFVRTVMCAARGAMRVPVVCASRRAKLCTTCVRANFPRGV